MNGAARARARVCVYVCVRVSVCVRVCVRACVCVLRKEVEVGERWGGEEGRGGRQAGMGDFT